MTILNMNKLSNSRISLELNMERIEFHNNFLWIVENFGTQRSHNTNIYHHKPKTYWQKYAILIILCVKQPITNKFWSRRQLRTRIRKENIQII